MKKNKTRVLYVSQGYSTHDRRFLERLRESGHEVWFLPCGRDPVRYETRPVPAGVHALPPLREGFPRGPLRDAWISVWRLRAHARRIRPQVVHAGPLQTGAFFCALAGCRPLLAMCWGSDVLVTPLRSPWLRWVTRFTLRKAQRVLADCAAVQQRVAELSGLPPKRIVTFPYGVDLNAYEEIGPGLNLRDRLQWQGCRILISTRSLEPNHGALVLMKALRRILPALPDVRVLMLGDGSLREKIQAQVRREGFEGRIHLEGQVAEERMPAYFREADLYVSAAFSDGTSVSLLGAMAAGLPVVVTDGSGNREWVRHGVQGWLAPPGDAVALAGALQEALALDVSERLKIGRSNSGEVRERADWGRNFGRLLSAYGELIHA